MLVVGAVPLLVAAALTEYAVTSAHRDDVAKLESAVLAETASQVQNFVSSDILAQTHVVIPYGPDLAEATSAQQYVLAQIVTARPWLISESFVNLAGQETFRVSQDMPQGYPASALSDLSQDPGFLAAKAGDYYLGPVAYASGTPQVAFASPVKNNDGQIIAVTTGMASLEPLGAVVASSTVGATGYLYLVDGTGKMIAGGGPFSGAIG